MKIGRRTALVFGFLLFTAACNGGGGGSDGDADDPGQDVPDGLDADAGDDVPDAADWDDPDLPGDGADTPVDSPADPEHDLPPGSARLLFTDVTSAPAGAFVTVWGMALGSSGTLRVGGTAVAPDDVLSWGADPNIPWLDRIEFRQTVAGGGDVTVEGAAGSLPMAEHEGRLLFVDHTAGNDANDGLSETDGGGGVGPWQTLPHARSQMQQGDVLYLRAGTYTEMDNDTWDTLFHALDMDGTADRPYAVVGYPGEVPVIDASVADGVRRAVMTGDFWTVAKLRFENGGAVSIMLDGDTRRAVGNVFTNCGPGNSGVVTFNAGSRHTRVFGNYLFDYGVPGENNSQGIYHGSFSSDNTDIEIAYNRLVGQRGGRHIQFYGHQADELTTDIRVHHNEIDTGPYDGILLGRSDGDGTDAWMEGVDIHHNTIRATSRSCIYMGALGENLNASIHHNVCFDSDSSSILVTDGSTGTVEITDNCLDMDVTDNVGPPTSNVHDNDTDYPDCTDGRGHLAF